jgi:hypothetical protein
VIQRLGFGRRAAVATVLGLALPVLTGCGLEAKDETSKEHSQIQAVASQVGGVRIRNAFITTPLVSQPKGPDAYLVVTLVNGGRSADRLVGVSTATGVATIPGGSITLGRGIVVSVSDPDIDPTDPSIPISGKVPTVGTTVPVQFSFATGGNSAELQVPVVSPDGLSLSPTQSIPAGQATPPAADAPLATD